MFKNILIVLSVLCCLYATYVFAEVFKKDMEQYRAEGRCVASLIAKGVERKDIKTFNGTCVMKQYTVAGVTNPQKNVDYGLPK